MPFFTFSFLTLTSYLLMAFHILLALHIAAGTTGLLLFPLIIVLKKATRLHVQVGNVFFWAMLVAASVSLVLAVMPNHHNPFLFAVGIFTLYANTTGYRASYLARHGQANTSNYIDYIASGAMLLASLFFVAFGIYCLLNGNTLGIAYLFFAGLSARNLQHDYELYFVRTAPPVPWLRRHIIRMMTTGIASFTAFTVVNVQKDLGAFSFLPWVLPAAIISPLIFYYVKKWTPKKISIVSQ